MNVEQFPNAIVRASIKMAQALEHGTRADFAEALRWLNTQRNDLRQCCCHRDTYTGIAKQIRKDLKSFDRPLPSYRSEP